MFVPIILSPRAAAARGAQARRPQADDAAYVRTSRPLTRSGHRLAG
jgi:hypothetical protein